MTEVRASERVAAESGALAVAWQEQNRLAGFRAGYCWPCCRGRYGAFSLRRIVLPADREGDES